MEMGNFLVTTGCSFHRYAGGAKGRYRLFLPFVAIKHAALMGKVHLGRHLVHALPHVSKCELQNSGRIQHIDQQLTHVPIPTCSRNKGKTLAHST